MTSSDWYKSACKEEGTTVYWHQWKSEGARAAHVGDLRVSEFRGEIQLLSKVVVKFAQVGEIEFDVDVCRRQVWAHHVLPKHTKFIRKCLWHHQERH